MVSVGKALLIDHLALNCACVGGNSKTPLGVVSFAETNTWCMSPFVTGNKDFHGLLASHQANSQAEAVRMIQIKVDRYPVVPFDEDPQREAELVQSAINAAASALPRNRRIALATAARIWNTWGGSRRRKNVISSGAPGRA